MRGQYRSARCTKCKGTPAQHNSRDPYIVIILGDGVRTHEQHGFVFGDGK